MLCGVPAGRGWRSFQRLAVRAFAKGGHGFDLHGGCATRAMAHLLRLALALFLLVGVASQAVASVPTVTQQSPEGWCRSKAGNTFALGCVSGEGASGRVATGELVIAQLWAADNAGLAAQYKRTPDGPVTCGPFSGSNAVNCTQSGYWMNGSIKITTSQGAAVFAYCPVVGGARVLPGGTVEATACTSAPTCPVNSALSGGSCQCNAGYMEQANACVVKPSQLEQFCKDAVSYKNAFPQHGSINIASPIPSLSCYKPDPPFPGPDATRGCAMTLGDGIAVPRDGVPTLRDWSATGVPTGATCEDAAASENAPKATPDPCPNGFAGTLNGATVCAERQPDKGIEGVKGTQVNNADGTSTSIKETTKCEGGKCTTTTETTTKDATGAVVGAVKVEGKTESIGEKCKADPANKVCTATGTGDGPGGAGMTGNCASGFVVKGDDPILNAMALEQYKRNCEVLGSTNDDSAWVTGERDRTTDRTADNPNNSTVSFSAGDIDTSDALGSGARCITDKVVQVAGFSVALPFSKVCPSLELLGNVLLGVSLLAAAGIVLRG